MFAIAAESGRPLSASSQQRILAWYAQRAPTALDTPPQLSAMPPSPLAEAVTVLFDAQSPLSIAAVAHVQFAQLNAAGSPALLYGDMASGVVGSWTIGSGVPHITQLAKLRSVAHLQPVDFDRDGRVDILAADLGLRSPSDERLGAVVLLHQGADGRFSPLYLAQNLGRVADARAFDYDADGDLDIVVAEFGFRRVGSVFLMENRTARSSVTPTTFARITLDRRAGALRTEVADLDGDGRLDIIAGIAQQHESVTVYWRSANGFEPQEILVAPHPNWGLNGLVTGDVDGDGDLDVVVANGDSMDDGVMLKPYHGVTLLKNLGHRRFERSQIAPLYGATGLALHDLDGDGDLDVLASTWLQQPPTAATDRELADIVRVGLAGIVWFEQDAAGRFRRHRLAAAGRSVPSFAIWASATAGESLLAAGRFDFEAKKGARSGRLEVIDIWRWPPRPISSKP